jgi:plasmid stabilization system protein ParE
MPQISKTPRRCIACVVVLVAFLFVCPANVAAIPLAEYEQRLKQAINELVNTTKVDTDQEWVESDFERRMIEAVEIVRVALPEHVTVEADGEVYNIDNSWLHQSFDELTKLPGAKQFEKAEKIIEVLQAIEVRITERQGAVAAAQSKEQAKSKLESILARPEYATDQRGPNAISRLIRDFIRWLQDLFPKRSPVEPGRVDVISLIAQLLVIGVALAVLLYVGKILLGRIGRRARKAKKPKKKEARIVLGERLEPEATSTDLLSQAEILARNGELRTAIRKAYIAFLVELGDRKMISLAQHKTNRDYLNSVKSVAPLHATMRGLTDSFERHWYGFEQATLDDWQTFRAGYVAALRAES